MKDHAGDARQMARGDISCYPFSVRFLRPLIALKEASDVCSRARRRTRSPVSQLQLSVRDDTNNIPDQDLKAGKCQK